MHPFELHFAAAWSPDDWSQVNVLVAVSGGADSVALLRAMAALKARASGRGQLVIAHFNHQLRGVESDADEAFVTRLCRAAGAPCEVGRSAAQEYANGFPDGLEAAARAARYAFLQCTAERLGARYVVTAHTADDQAETVLHRILRGTGLGGLAGMRRARPLGATSLIRPLLGVRRSEVLSYLTDLGQTYCEDATNAQTQWTRNRIRHELLPHLADRYNGKVVQSLLRLSSLAGEAQAVIDQLVEDYVERCVVSPRPDTVRVDCRPLADQRPFIVRELLIAVWKRQGWPLQSMGFAQWDELAGMVADGAEGRSVGQQTFPGQVAADVEDDQLRLWRMGT